MAKKAKNQFLIDEFRKSAQQIVDDTVDLYKFTSSLEDSQIKAISAPKIKSIQSAASSIYSEMANGNIKDVEESALLLDTYASLVSGTPLQVIEADRDFYWSSLGINDTKSLWKAICDSYELNSVQRDISKTVKKLSESKSDEMDKIYQEELAELQYKANQLQDPNKPYRNMLSNATVQASNMLPDTLRSLGISAGVIGVSSLLTYMTGGTASPTLMSALKIASASKKVGIASAGTNMAYTFFDTKERQYGNTLYRLYNMTDKDGNQINIKEDSAKKVANTVSIINGLEEAIPLDTLSLGLLNGVVGKSAVKATAKPVREFFKDYVVGSLFEAGTEGSQDVTEDYYIDKFLEEYDNKNGTSFYVYDEDKFTTYLDTFFKSSSDAFLPSMIMSAGQSLVTSPLRVVRYAKNQKKINDVNKTYDIKTTLHTENDGNIFNASGIQYVSKSDIYDGYENMSDGAKNYFNNNVFVINKGENEKVNNRDFSSILDNCITIDEKDIPEGYQTYSNGETTIAVPKLEVSNIVVDERYKKQGYNSYKDEATIAMQNIIENINGKVNELSPVNILDIENSNFAKFDNSNKQGNRVFNSKEELSKVFATERINNETNTILFDTEQEALDFIQTVKDKQYAIEGDNIIKNSTGYADITFRIDDNDIKYRIGVIDSKNKKDGLFQRFFAISEDEKKTEFYKNLSENGYTNEEIKKVNQDINKIKTSLEESIRNSMQDSNAKLPKNIVNNIEAGSRALYILAKREGMNVDDFMSLINVKFDSELDDINGIFKKANTILNQIPTNREEFTIKNRLFNKETPNNLINDKLSIKAFKLNKNEDVALQYYDENRNNNVNITIDKDAYIVDINKEISKKNKENFISYIKDTFDIEDSEFKDIKNLVSNIKDKNTKTYKQALEILSNYSKYFKDLGEPENYLFNELGNRPDIIIDGNDYYVKNTKKINVDVASYFKRDTAQTEKIDNNVIKSEPVKNDIPVIVEEKPIDDKITGVIAENSQNEQQNSEEKEVKHKKTIKKSKKSDIENEKVEENIQNNNTSNENIVVEEQKTEEKSETEAKNNEEKIDEIDYLTESFLNDSDFEVEYFTKTIDGYKEIFDNNTKPYTITLGKNANVSTIIHEVGHLLRSTLKLEELQNVSKLYNIDTTDWIIDSTEITQKDDKFVFNNKEYATEEEAQKARNKSIEAEENFAIDFTQFIYEGKTYSTLLNNIFSKIKSMLTSIAKSLLRNGQLRKENLSEPIYEMFNELLITDYDKAHKKFKEKEKEEIEIEPSEKKEGKVDEEKINERVKEFGRFKYVKNDEFGGGFTSDTGIDLSISDLRSFASNGYFIPLVTIQNVINKGYGDNVILELEDITYTINDYMNAFTKYLNGKELNESENTLVNLFDKLHWSPEQLIGRYEYKLLTNEKYLKDSCSKIVEYLRPVKNKRSGLVEFRSYDAHDSVAVSVAKKVVSSTGEDLKIALEDARSFVRAYPGIWAREIFRADSGYDIYNDDTQNWYYKEMLTADQKYSNFLLTFSNNNEFEKVSKLSEMENLSDELFDDDFEIEQNIDKEIGWFDDELDNDLSLLDQEFTSKNNQKYNDLILKRLNNLGKTYKRKARVELNQILSNLEYQNYKDTVEDIQQLLKNIQRDVQQEGIKLNLNENDLKFIDSFDEVGISYDDIYEKSMNIIKQLNEDFLYNENYSEELNTKLSNYFEDLRSTIKESLNNHLKLTQSLSDIKLSVANDLRGTISKEYLDKINQHEKTLAKYRNSLSRAIDTLKIRNEKIEQLQNINSLLKKEANRANSRLRAEYTRRYKQSISKIASLNSQVDAEFGNVASYINYLVGNKVKQSDNLNRITLDDISTEIISDTATNTQTSNFVVSKLNEDNEFAIVSKNGIELKNLSDMITSQYLYEPIGKEDVFASTDLGNDVLREYSNIIETVFTKELIDELSTYQNNIKDIIKRELDVYIQNKSKDSKAIIQKNVAKFIYNYLRNKNVDQINKFIQNEKEIGIRNIKKVANNLNAEYDEKDIETRDINKKVINNYEIIDDFVSSLRKEISDSFPSELVKAIYNVTKDYDKTYSNINNMLFNNFSAWGVETQKVLYNATRDLKKQYKEQLQEKRNAKKIEISKKTIDMANSLRQDFGLTDEMKKQFISEYIDRNELEDFNRDIEPDTFIKQNPDVLNYIVSQLYKKDVNHKFVGDVGKKNVFDNLKDISMILTAQPTQIFNYLSELSGQKYDDKFSGSFNDFFIRPVLEKENIKLQNIDKRLTKSATLFNELFKTDYRNRINLFTSTDATIINNGKAERVSIESLGLLPVKVYKSNYDKKTKTWQEASKQNGTRQDAMAVYIYSKQLYQNDVAVRNRKVVLNEDNLTHPVKLLKNGNGIDFATIEDLHNNPLKYLTKEEKSFADFMINEVGSTFNEIKKIKYDIDNVIMDSVKDYFPLKDAKKRFSDIMTSSSKGKPKANNSMTKARTNAIYELDLNVVDIFEEAVKQQEHYIAFAEWANTFNRMWDSQGNLKQLIEKSAGKEMSKFVYDYASTVVNRHYLRPKQTEEIMNRVIGNSSVAKICGSITTLFRQFGSVINASTSLKISPKEIAKAFADIFKTMPDSDKTWAQWIDEVDYNIKERNLSPVNEEALSKFSRNLFDNSETIDTVKKYTTDKMIDLVKKTDKFFAQVVWLACYRKYYFVYSNKELDVYKGANNINKESVYKAMMAVRSTQSGSSVVENTTLQNRAVNGSYLWKAITQFSNDIIKLQSSLIWDTNRNIKNKDISSAICTLAVLPLFSILFNCFLNGDWLPEEDDDLPVDYNALIKDLLAELANTSIPVVGKYVGNNIQGYGNESFIPFVDPISNLIQTAYKIVNPPQGKERSEVAIRGAKKLGLDALELAGMPSEFVRKVLNVFVDPNDLSPQVNIGYLFNSNVGNYMKGSALTIDN